ncbi:putative Poly (ADP-ribose) glycohydrolase (PARG)-containing protein [Homarus americanus]|uniref:Putative Poly (ADP-ribose) glycohydrolase (PARG)-containing protein n=1 Tax=Homarus americanus TaxID=6706 RepID=A0A8J5N2T8_HOMAM|nr:putative Poly (ADP-ribose) glycohydrolase (PARG)-containing protein [Homarus americanus]
MAFVLLPCDLPTWPTIQRHLNSLKGTTSPDHLTQVLYSLHSLCNVSIEPDLNERVPEDIFAGVSHYLKEEADQDFFTTTLPFMVGAALKLKDLKPPKGLTYSLQQQGEDVTLDRELVTSLLAHMLFCTLPRRTLVSHPTLTDPCLAPTLSSLHRVNVDLVLQRMLNLCCRVNVNLVLQRMLNLCCRVNVDLVLQKVMVNKDFLSLKDWMKCEEVLCPVNIQHEGRLEEAPPPALLTCFTSPNLARPALTKSNSQLEDNEALQVCGALRTSTVSNLKTRPSFIPRKTVGPPDLIHVLMDADDYRQSEVLQYEEINVLRELNKARLAFTQDLPPPPPNQSLSDIVSVSRQHSRGSASPPTRFRTQVSSDASEEDKKGDPGSSSQDTNNKQLPNKGSTERWVNESEVLKRGGARDKRVEIIEGDKCDVDKEGGGGVVIVRDKKGEDKEGNKGVKMVGSDGQVDTGVKSKTGTLPKTRRGKNVSKPTEKRTEKTKVITDDKQTENDQDDTKQKVTGNISVGDKPLEKQMKKVKVVTDEKPKERRSEKQDSHAGSVSVGEPGSSYVTAPSTMKRRRRRKKSGARCTTFDVAEKPPDGGVHSKRPQKASLQEEQQPPQHSQPRTIARPKGKPPLPEVRPRPNTDAAEPPPPQQQVTHNKQRIGEAPDGRKLSLYYSCDSAPQDVSHQEEDPYYSACESLDGQDDRLKEALARKPSVDSELPILTHTQNDSDDANQTHPRLPRGEVPLPTTAKVRAPLPDCRGEPPLPTTAKVRAPHPHDCQVGAPLPDCQGEGPTHQATKVRAPLCQGEFPTPTTVKVRPHPHAAKVRVPSKVRAPTSPRLPPPLTTAKPHYEPRRQGKAPVPDCQDEGPHSPTVTAKVRSPLPDCQGEPHSPRWEEENKEEEEREREGTDLSEDEEEGGSKEEEEEEEEEEEAEGEDENGSRSSHYSFSSDYISDLEEVYEQLEAVLQEQQEGQLGPRTAAIARFAHGLLKLDIVCRLLGDRGWRVGDLVATLLRYSESRLDSWRRRETELTESADSSLPESHRYRSPSLDSLTLFDELIGADRPFITMETEL